MRLLVILVLIPALTSGGDSDRSDLHWLEGCWAATDSSAQEVWVVDDEQLLIGFGVSIHDAKVGFYELMSIRKSEHGSWTYTAHPSGQASASFIATQIGENSVVFVNPDHDYPQEIRYRREGSRLHATVSLLAGVNPTNFDKAACG
jgi:hypothetical protein